MQAKELQEQLVKMGENIGASGADGIVGANTRAALDRVLKKEKLNFSLWSDARRRVAFEQIVYKKAGFYEGELDGLVGEQTRQAVRLWEASKVSPQTLDRELTWKSESLKTLPEAVPPLVVRPGQVKPFKVPTQTEINAAREKWPAQSQMRNFFGAPGTNLVRMTFPYPQVVAWDLTSTVTSTLVNAKCLKAFTAIFQKTLDHYGMDEIRRLRLNMYGGCYNNRSMLGGNVPSTHAYAAAWDIDPERNQLKWGRNLASLDAPEYDAFWSFVEMEGMISLGRHANYDWMHFQATKNFK
ncbi:MAG: hypothetical protein E6R03_16650 [Hyphomicrobiaceae bacterium]|nr:MAG: hypothetical protein E6R03_16650 [Hyphomicrobiaceae bacterium]